MKKCLFGWLIAGNVLLFEGHLRYPVRIKIDQARVGRGNQDSVTNPSRIRTLMFPVLPWVNRLSKSERPCNAICSRSSRSLNSLVMGAPGRVHVLVGCPVRKFHWRKVQLAKPIRKLSWVVRTWSRSSDTPTPSDWWCPAWIRASTQDQFSRTSATAPQNCSIRSSLIPATLIRPLPTI